MDFDEDSVREKDVKKLMENITEMTENSKKTIGCATYMTIMNMME